MPVTNQKILKTVEDLAVTMKEGFKKVDEKLKKIDEKLDIIEIYVANHDNALKALPTREEFEKHQEENLNFQYAVAKKLELKKFAKPEPVHA